MLDLFSIYPALSSLTATGQAVSSNHFGRSTNILPFGQTGDSLQEGGFNIAGDYYANFLEDNFLQHLNQYAQAQRDLDPNWSAITDPNLPRPMQGQGQSIVHKYETLTGKTNYGLLNDSDVIVSGAMAELQPYWERMLIDTMIQEQLNNSDRSLVDLKYMQEGRNSVAHILDKDEYQQAKEVEFAYANSIVFLSLTEDQKTQYITMSLANQWEMIYLEKALWDSHLDLNSGHYLTSATSQLGEYDAALQAEKDSMDLSNVLSKFETYNRYTHRDYRSEFEAIFEEQTKPLSFDSISNQLKGVFMLYQGVLNRVPDKGGFEYWVREINEGYTLEQLAVGFVYSEEFQERTGSESWRDVTFDKVLTGLYSNVLGREPDQSGYDWWTNEYESGRKEIGNVVTGFTWSEEFYGIADEEMHAWLSATYGPNLKDLDWQGLGFNEEQTDSIGLVGQYDINSDHGYAGVVFQ
ncbi:DUF4214 domain-containing protein [Neptuniibacter sp. QD37_11]|uniref:DUF4214 domain-containing protein n=1 Tax=Neptuniibacter sp. QD37_11 TaxID=3398209 RepID=UPI0039F48358